MKIIIDTDNNTLLSSVETTNPVISTDLTFYQDTTPYIDVYLLKNNIDTSVNTPYQTYTFSNPSTMSIGLGVINFSSSILLTSSSLSYNTLTNSWTGSLNISSSNINTQLISGSSIIMQVNHLTGSYVMPLFYDYVTIETSLIK
jgi:hypothetical protein